MMRRGRPTKTRVRTADRDAACGCAYQSGRCDATPSANRAAYSGTLARLFAGAGASDSGAMSCRSD